MTEATIQVAEDEVIVTFDAYGETRYSIKATKCGLLITGIYLKKDGRDSKSSIGTTAIDRTSLRVDMI
jgi:hypothetical protein